MIGSTVSWLVRKSVVVTSFSSVSVNTNSVSVTWPSPSDKADKKVTTVGFPGVGAGASKKSIAGGGFSVIARASASPISVALKPNS